MAHQQDDRLAPVDSSPAQLHQRRIGSRFGIIEPYDLSDIRSFHGDVVEHRNMQRLGLEVQVGPFLAGMQG